MSSWPVPSLAEAGSGHWRCLLYEEKGRRMMSLNMSWNKSSVGGGIRGGWLMVEVSIL